MLYVRVAGLQGGYIFFFFFFLFLFLWLLFELYCCGVIDAATSGDGGG